MNYGAPPDALSYVAAVVFFVWLVAIIRLNVWAQVHHGWAILLAAAPELPVWVRVPSFVIGLDDAYQHVRQCWDWRYTSPIHKLYARVRQSLTHGR